MSIDSLPYRLRPADGEPEGAVVLIHGRGADEYDLLPLLDTLDPQRRLVGVSPRGPLSLPPGGAHWYVVKEIGRPDPATFRATYELVTAWLDALPSAAVTPAGDLVVAYDAKYVGRCFYYDPADPTRKIYTKVERIWWAVRWAAFAR